MASVDHQVPTAQNAARELIIGGMVRSIPYIRYSKTVTGISEHIDWFIYLTTNCSNEDIADITKEVLDRGGMFDREACHIVIPQTLNARARNALAELRSQNLVHVYEALMWQKVEWMFAGYLESMQEQVAHIKAKNYIEPQIYATNESGDATDELISIEKLTDTLNSEQRKDGVVVIQGDAGVAKQPLPPKSPKI